MKALFVFLFSISTLFNYSIFDPIAEAISVGDVDTLSTFFDAQVEVSVLEEEDLYSKATAKKVLQRFFTAHEPMTFELVHKGTSEGQKSIYFVGTLSAPTATFRVYIYLQTVGGKSLIQELRIEEE